VNEVAHAAVEQTPPQAIPKQKARWVLLLVPRKKRRAVIELFHWALYGLVLGEMRARPQETPE
jgi:hypothetical protein